MIRNQESMVWCEARPKGILLAVWTFWTSSEAKNKPKMSEHRSLTTPALAHALKNEIIERLGRATTPNWPFRNVLASCAFMTNVSSTVTLS